MPEHKAVDAAFESWRNRHLKDDSKAIRNLEPLEIPQGSGDYVEDIGFPGEPPFTRGVYPTMYRGRHWTMRQYAGFGTAEETNARFRQLLDVGQTGLSVAFDLPTQMGYDSDHPLADGEVGRVGVAIDDVDDMNRLFDGIDLAQITTSMTINATAPILVALYAAVGKIQGASQSDLAGTVQNDVLKEYVARGTFIYPVHQSVALSVDLMAYCGKMMPAWNPISVSGYHMREAGATAAQEIAFTLAHGLAYAEAAREKGLSLDQLLPRFSFFFGVHNDFLEEVAKFRAARRLWDRLVRDRLGVSAPESRRLRFHSQTCGSTLTAQDPMNNAIRGPYQALAAVLGGTQSLHVNAFDEAIGLPTDKGARLALRTQQILAHETGITRTADPLGGSFAIEKLTDRLEEEAVAIIEAVDSVGGAVDAAGNGYTAGKIADSAYAAQKRIDSGEDTVIGVNRFQSETESPEPFALDPDGGVQQREALVKKKRLRDATGTGRSLDAVRRKAEAGEGITESIVDACAAGVTGGEIADVLREVFGTHGGNRG